MITAVEKYFPFLDNEQKQKFNNLSGLYREWNDRINVISRKDIDNFEINHLLHSLSIARLITFKQGTEVIDIGTGGGLPGIPLAIMFPGVHFTLIDSIAKKIKVVEGIASSLGLNNVTPVTGRSEDFKGSYSFIICRAVTDITHLVSQTRHLVSPVSSNDLKNGYICLKGGDLEDEIKHYSEKITVKEIKQWFEEPFFETKKIVYMQW